MGLAENYYTQVGDIRPSLQALKDAHTQGVRSYCSAFWRKSEYIEKIELLDHLTKRLEKTPTMGSADKFCCKTSVSIFRFQNCCAIKTWQVNNSEIPLRQEQLARTHKDKLTIG